MAITAAQSYDDDSSLMTTMRVAAMETMTTRVTPLKKSSVLTMRVATLMVVRC